MEETINRTLKIHALSLEDWDYQKHIKFLHEWAERFINEFKLNIETPAIQIDVAHFRQLGSYRFGRNGFGLLREITLNSTYIERPIPEILETLFHETLHEWQDLHGKVGKSLAIRNYHNKEFRKKAMYYGLVVDQWGHSLGVRTGLFKDLLERYGIDTSILPLPGNKNDIVEKFGKSKMKKWTCGCTIVRAAVELEAQCLKCGSRFRKE
jgi:hypothetical protein